MPSSKAEIGDIRTRADGDYKKVAEGKWVRWANGRDEAAKETLRQPSPIKDQPRVHPLAPGASWKGDSQKGYQIDLANGTKATLVKEGKEWMIHVDGRRVSLGRKATFDHAERVLSGRTPTGR